MKVLNLDTTLEPLTALRPHPRNPRRGNTPAIRDSISHTGFYGSIIAQKSTGFILAGNHRYLAAQEAGAQEIPVTWIDVDDDHALQILLADNRTSDLAEYDDRALAELLQELQGTDLGALGYTGDDVNRALKGLHEDEDDTADADQKLSDADEIQAKWLVKPGDTWIIPSIRNPAIAHVIHCGDSLNPETTQRLRTTPADMVFTDPPFGVAYTGKTDDALTIANDKHTDETLRAFLHAAFTAWPLRAGGAYYVCSTSGPLELQFRKALQDAGHPVRQAIAWVKNTIVLGHADYHYRHETILYGWKPGGERFFTRDRTQSTVINPPKNINDMTEAELRAHARELRRQIKDTVWLEDKPRASRLHPTTKPIHLTTRAIYNSTVAGQTVFDGFSGSGSTGLACEATGRAYTGVELDPKYVAVSLERFSERGLTPRRANAEPAKGGAN